MTQGCEWRTRVIRVRRGFHGHMMERKGILGGRRGGGGGEAAADGRSRRPGQGRVGGVSRLGFAFVGLLGKSSEERRLQVVQGGLCHVEAAIWSGEVGVECTRLVIPTAVLLLVLILPTIQEALVLLGVLGELGVGRETALLLPRLVMRRGPPGGRAASPRLFMVRHGGGGGGGGGGGALWLWEGLLWLSSLHRRRGGPCSGRRRSEGRGQRWRPAMTRGRHGTPSTHRSSRCHRERQRRQVGGGGVGRQWLGVQLVGRGRARGLRRSSKES